MGGRGSQKPVVKQIHRLGSRNYQVRGELIRVRDGRFVSDNSNMSNPPPSKEIVYGKYSVPTMLKFQNNLILRLEFCRRLSQPLSLRSITLATHMSIRNPSITSEQISARIGSKPFIICRKRLSVLCVALTARANDSSVVFNGTMESRYKGRPNPMIQVQVRYVGNEHTTLVVGPHLAVVSWYRLAKSIPVGIRPQIFSINSPMVVLSLISLLILNSPIPPRENFPTPLLRF